MKHNNNLPSTYQAYRETDEFKEFLSYFLETGKVWGAYAYLLDLELLSQSPSALLVALADSYLQMAIYLKAQEQPTEARLFYSMAHELIGLDEGMVALEGRKRVIRILLENYLPLPIARLPIVVRVAEALAIYNAKRRFAYGFANI